jgi:hypothetical protein
LAILSQNAAFVTKKIILTLVFKKDANFLPKIAENRGHNIDPGAGATFLPVAVRFEAD